VITEALLAIVVGLLSVLDGLLPDLTIEGAGAAAGSFMSGLFVLNGYVPIVDLLAGTLLLLSARFVMSGWHIVVWIYHQFWGSS